MENEEMKFDFETQEMSDANELVIIKEKLIQLTNTVSELIQKHYEADKKRESDLAVQKAYEMFVGKDKEDNNICLDDNLDQACPPVDEKVFDEEQTVDDFSILTIIPDQAKKWVGRLTVNEMIQAITDADAAEGYESEDEYIGQLVDNLKDMAIAKYTNDILEGRVTKIDDEEIKSEVIDYMKSKKLDIPETIEPKQDSVKSIIERLDNGEEIELEEALLDEVFDKLWSNRNNIEIKIRNNKISIR